uniref:uncharacterized protein LOC122607053 n=1 Tax=Erigeron canadensis TaxID=72917 RepID=UPI001CB9839C|nr:uncharacterized protein LOC122607053 [Erigeron canadensis]
MGLDTESGKSVAPMDLDSVSDKSSPPPAVEEERPIKRGKHPVFGTRIADSEKYRETALNHYSQLTKPEQRRCLLTACSSIICQEMDFQWKNKTILSEDDMVKIKELALKKAESIGEDASAQHARIRKTAVQPCIINDEIRNEIIKRAQDYWMKMEEATKCLRENPFKNKLKNKSDDQGACSVTKFHQSDDQQRKRVQVVAQKKTTPCTKYIRVNRKEVRHRCDAVS